jgi:hypothetical protein
MRNLMLIPKLPFDLPEIKDITDQLPSHPNKQYTLRQPEEITHISVHHAGIEGGTVEGHAKYHTNSHGWPRIGYHIVVDKGQIYQVNDILSLSYHTKGNNSHSVGIMLNGNFTQREMTAQERNALYGAIMTVRKAFNIPVGNIKGHREYGVNTSCPGFDMNRVREDIQTLQMKMDYEASKEHKVKSAWEVMNQLTYMYNLVQKEESEWALNRFQELYEDLKKKGLL